MDLTVSLIGIAVVSYLIGSFPSAIIISKLIFGFDIRTKGSGNMGSTNVYRVLGWYWGLIVQILDIFKGMVPVLFVVKIFLDASYFQDEMLLSTLILAKIIAGVSAVLGHIFSFAACFKGGKGVNTAAGMLIGLVPVDVAIAFGMFAIIVALSGYISLGSISAAFAIPSSIYVREKVFNTEIYGFELLFIFSVAICLLVLYTHRQNIKRLIKGSENKFAKLQIIKLCKNKKIQNI